MYKVGVKQLKNELSRHIKAAAAGETVLVTDRDRVVAELGPPRSEPEPWADHPLADLIRRGVVKPAKRRDGLPVSPVLDVSLDQLMADLEADRADRP